MSLQQQSSDYNIIRTIDYYMWVLTCRGESERDGYRKNGTIVGCVTCGGLPTQTGTRVTFSIDSKHLSTEIILRNRQNKFVLNLLDVRQHELVKHFGLQSGRKVDKFEGKNLPFKTLSDDESKIESLILAGTAGWMECEIIHVSPFEDRIILVVSANQTSFIAHDHLANRLALLMQYLTTRQLPNDIKCPLSLSILYVIDPQMDGRAKQLFAGHANIHQLIE